MLSIKRYLILVCLLIVVLGMLFQELVTAQGQAPLIYFISSTEGIFRFDPANGQAELMHEGEQSTFQFSNDGQQVAFWDEQGLWISSLADWNPILVYADASDNVESLQWIPNDTRIVIVTSNEKRGLAYNLEAHDMEEWPWFDCGTLAQHVETHRIVAVCSNVNAQPPAVAVYWNGEYEPFSDESFVLVGLGDFQEHVFDWAGYAGLVVYVDRSNIDRLVRFDEVTYILYEGVETPQTILQTHLWDTNHIAVSPDGKLVAVMTLPGPGDLYVLNTSDGQQIGSPLQINVRIVRDVAWYPDGKRIVILDDDYPVDSLKVIDISQATIQEYPLSQDHIISSIAIAHP